MTRNRSRIMRETWLQHAAFKPDQTRKRLTEVAGGDLVEGYSKCQLRDGAYGIICFPFIYVTEQIVEAEEILGRGHLCLRFPKLQTARETNGLSCGR